jgi:hypothetical protein
MLRYSSASLWFQAYLNFWLKLIEDLNFHLKISILCGMLFFSFLHLLSLYRFCNPYYKLFQGFEFKVTTNCLRFLISLHLHYPKIIHNNFKNCGCFNFFCNFFLYLTKFWFKILKFFLGPIILHRSWHYFAPCDLK